MIDTLVHYMKAPFPPTYSTVHVGVDDDECDVEQKLKKARKVSERLARETGTPGTQVVDTDLKLAAAHALLIIDRKKYKDVLEAQMQKDSSWLQDFYALSRGGYQFKQGYDDYEKSFALHRGSA